MIRLLIVDDHELMREGLKQLLEGENDIAVSAEAGNGEETLAIMQDGTFDLVLLDLSMPGIHGVELIKKIKERPDSPPILVLSMHNEPEIVKRKLKFGASGYITKDSSAKDLLEAMRKVASGERFIAADIAEQIAFEASAGMQLVAHELLSARELMILRMLVEGKNANEIALDLGISSKTVSTHKTRLMNKMHIDSEVKLMQYIIVHGMVL